jgi:hypothetical protein
MLKKRQGPITEQKMRSDLHIIFPKKILHITFGSELINQTTLNLLVDLLR